MEPVKITGALERISSSINLLTNSEAKIAQWILDHPQEVLHSTVRDVAKASKGSESAVIRLCKSIDIEGFAMLKVLLTADIVRQEGQHNDFEEITAHSSFNDIVRQLQLGAITTIQSTVREIHDKDIECITEWMKHSHRIVIFGVGASGVVAKDFHQKLVRLGLPAIYPEDFHQAATIVGQLSTMDLLIAISYSGLTTDTLEIVDIAKGRNMKIVGITHFYTKNPLWEQATQALGVMSMEPQTRVGATHSIIGSLILIDIITLYFANRYFSDVYDNLNASRAAVAGHIKER